MSENRFYSAAIKDNISTTFIIPTKKYRNQYAISDKRSVRVLEWDGILPVAKVVRDAFTVETGPEYESNNYNMAKASPKSKFYGGTFSVSLCAGYPNSALYRYTKCLGVKRLIADQLVSSGMDWNKEAKKFYFIELCRYVVREYDWNPKTEEICKNSEIKLNFHSNVLLIVLNWIR